jgi:hypothetical protein
MAYYPNSARTIFTAGALKAQGIPYMAYAMGKAFSKVFILNNFKA